MRIELLAFYGGPDQVMTVTSGLASVVGLGLIFWNKLMGALFRIVRAFRRSAMPAVTRNSKNPPADAV